MAEQVTLWSDATFDGPFTDNIIATSGEISNNSGLNALDVTIDYKAITPDGENAQVNFSLQAVVEEETAPNVWVPIAAQHDEIKGTDEAQLQILSIRPTFNPDPGIPEKIQRGGQPFSSISREDRQAPERFRVVILQAIVGGGDPLTQVVISGWARKYSYGN